MPDLLSGLVQGYVDGQEKALQRQEKDDLRKLEIKSYKRKLEAQDQMEAAKQGLLKMLDPVMGQAAAYSEPDGESGITPGRMTPGMDLRQALQNPQGQALALKAGYNPADIKKFQAQSLPELLASMQTSGAVGGGTNGMNFSGFDVDAEGNPKLKFDAPTVKNWSLSPDGKSEIGYDEKGKAIANRPVGADKRAKEDEPILSAAKDYVDEKGNPPPSTTTWRELSNGRYKPVGDKITPDQGGRIAGLIQGQDQVKELRNALVDKNGKVNKKLVFQMADMGPIEGAPLTEGRQLRQNTEFAISSIVYTRTGAAMPPSELKKTLNQLLPGPLDNESGVKAKLDRLDKFLSGSLDVITLPPSVKEAYEKRKASNPGSNNVVDFSKLPK